MRNGLDDRFVKERERESAAGWKKWFETLAFFLFWAGVLRKICRPMNNELRVLRRDESANENDTDRSACRFEKPILLSLGHTAAVTCRDPRENARIMYLR